MPFGEDGEIQNIEHSQEIKNDFRGKVSNKLLRITIGMMNKNDILIKSYLRNSDRNKKVFDTLALGKYSLSSSIERDGIHSMDNPAIETYFHIDDSAKDKNFAKIKKYIAKTGVDVDNFASTRKEMLDKQLNLYQNILDDYSRNGGNSANISYNPFFIKYNLLKHFYTSKDSKFAMSIMKKYSGSKDALELDKLMHLRAFLVGIDTAINSLNFVETFSRIFAETDPINGAKADLETMTDIFRKTAIDEAALVLSPKSYMALATLSRMSEIDNSFLSRFVAALFRSDIHGKNITIPSNEGKLIDLEFDFGDEDQNIVKSNEEEVKAPAPAFFHTSGNFFDRLKNFNETDLFILLLSGVTIYVIFKCSILVIRGLYNHYIMRSVVSNYKKMNELRDMIEALSVHIWYREKNLESFIRNTPNPKEVERERKSINAQKTVLSKYVKQYDKIAERERKELNDNTYKGREYTPEYEIIQGKTKKEEHIQIISGEEIIKDATNGNLKLGNPSTRSSIKKDTKVDKDKEEKPPKMGEGPLPQKKEEKQEEKPADEIVF